MAGEDFTQGSAGAEGLDLGVGEADTGMPGNLGERHFFQMKQGEQGALAIRDVELGTEAPELADIAGDDLAGVAPEPAGSNGGPSVILGNGMHGGGQGGGGSQSDDDFFQEVVW